MSRKITALFAALLFSTFAFSQNTSTPMPPVAAKKPKTFEKFGDKLPKEMLTQYKLLIDNEIHDATIVPIPK